jgi:integrase
MSKRRPKYCHHKARDLAYVTVNGKVHYLGKYSSAESHDRYEDLVRDWQTLNSIDRHTITVDQLCLAFLKHAKGYYRKNGRETSEVSCIMTALRFLVATCGPTRVAEFGPKLLKETRQAMVDADLPWPPNAKKPTKRRRLTRRSINKNVERIRRMIKWGVAEELVQPEVLVGLQTVTGLKAGRCEAKEAAPVDAVPEADIEAVLKLVSPPVAGLIQIQRLTGMRPGEA